MRSIKYVVGGKPCNVTDCLDYCTRHKLQRLILKLLTPEEVSEEYTARMLKGSFIWFFDDITVSYEVVFGRCFSHEPTDRQRVSLQRANQRLDDELAAIKPALGGQTVENAEQRFDDSAIYPQT